ncbi:hypothetical protein H0H93_014429 [Arthromyces matolae]|nr:hypothetical protein H0H93_014429 [Arthromyces matolae]
MSRIPIPSHSPSNLRNSSTSPDPFSSDFDRPTSPPLRHNTRPSNSSMSTLSYGGSVPDTRKKQSKRDEAIRKKIESELSRKRTISTAQGQRGGKKGKAVAAKGTVAALKPTPALTVPENITVSEASQLCAAKRTDCVLVVDDEEGLSGIFTAKDLAYRVTAEGLDPHTTPVHQIMTRNPMVTRDTTSATEALQLMVSRHFRHLPVCNEDGNVVGLLDITKVFHEALSKVERSSVASEQLFTAMAGVQSELGGGVSANPQAAAMLAWAEKLREKTALPDLTTIMDSRTQPATVGPKTTVREVAKLMKERRTTAVCVMETVNAGGASRIAGIFTSKDVVLRVIAAGLDAGRCSVVRVMTPHPDTALPTTTIHDALKQMHNGHYLNLPVVEEDGRLVAIVDVLKLTYATLEQMNAVAGDNALREADGGPMWGRFFDSIGHDDAESVVSGSHHGPSDIRSLHSLHQMDQVQQSPHSEVHPNDSASVLDDDPVSALEGYPRNKGGAVAPTPAPLPVDDGTYVFKFRTPSGRTHRFQARHDDIEHLREIVAGKLATDPFFTEWRASSESDARPDPIDFHLSYTDADGDSVLVTSDSDVTDAVSVARKAGADRVVLFVQGGKGWVEAGADKSEAKAAAATVAAQNEVKEVEKLEALEQHVDTPPQAPVLGQEVVFGIPKDLLLPASIGALANTAPNSLLRHIQMPKSERDDVLAALSSRIFSAMVNDLVMDITLQSHQEVLRSRTLSNASRPGTPASGTEAKFINNSSGTGTNTPTGVKDAYGLNVFDRPSSEAGRSTSPTSDAGVSEESPKGKGKGKSMNKRAAIIDEAEYNLKRKRPASPQVSPAKNQKKQKTSGATLVLFYQRHFSHPLGSPVSRLKAGSETPGSRNSLHFSPSLSQSKIPSKLRDSSTASFVGGSSGSPSSRDSSPGVISAATPASSSFSKSPHIPNKKVTKGTVRVNGTGPPKRPSPPRPPPIHVLDYSLGRQFACLELNDSEFLLLDVEGEETGSSTDTDSS